MNLTPYFRVDLQLLQLFLHHNPMKKPTCWEEFGQLIYPSLISDFGGFDQGVAYIVENFPRSERKVLVAYLQFLTESNVSEEMRMQAWKESGSTIIPELGKYKDFYLHLIKKIEQKR